MGSAHLVCLLAADGGGSSRRISASQSSAMRACLVHSCSSSSQWARRSRSCSAAEGRIDSPREQQHDKPQHSRDRSPHHRDPPSRACGPHGSTQTRWPSAAHHAPLSLCSSGLTPLWASSSRLAGGSSSHGSLRIQAGASTQPTSTQRRRFGRGTAGMMAGQRGWLLGSQPALRAM